MPLYRQVAAVLQVDHARTGLYLIAQLLAPGRIWVPAYHCPAMVEPLIAAGCEVGFYPVTASLEPDLDFLASKVRARDALIGVRFFGFDTGISELAVFCGSKEATLIEDLAHAAYFEKLLGHYGVTSLLKFLPLGAGGELLVANANDHSKRLFKLHHDLPSAVTARATTLLRKLARRLGLSGAQKGGGRYFHADRACRGLAAADESLVDSSDHQAISEKRRDNYQYLAHALSDTASGVVMFPSLPDHVVPYVLPFLLNDATGFNELRSAGIQALRWEEMALTGCEVSVQYRSRLVQLPVHQQLVTRQLDAIVAALTD